MPVECEELEDRLTDVVAGRAGDAERRALERHLEQCASCRTEAQTLRSAMDFLNGLTVPDPGEEFWQRFPDAIGEMIREDGETVPAPSEHRTRRSGLRRLVGIRLRLAVPAVPAAALLVVLVSAAFVIGTLWHRRTEEPLARLRQTTGNIATGEAVTGNAQLTREPRSASADHPAGVLRARVPADLGLDEATMKELLHAQGAWLASVDRLQAQRRELFADLRRELRSSANDATLAAAVKALQRNSQRLYEADAGYDKSLDRLLKPRQHALYLLSNEERAGNGGPKAVYDEGVSTHASGVVENRGE